VKRLDKVLEIGPKYTEEFKQANVRTLRDLADVKDLSKLSADTRIPIELIQNWHEEAERKSKASRYRRRVAGALAIVALSVFGWLFRHAYEARSAAAQPGAQAETQGEQLYDKGDYGAALREFERAIQLDPENSLVYVNRGAALRMVGRAQEALSSLNKALELDPSDVWAWDQRGEAYSDLGQYGRALQDFEKAIQLNPKYAIAHADKAFALRKLGHAQKPVMAALSSLNKALDIDPKSVCAWDHRG
jgi:tetratricopeptide (TPR) repeat protein